MNIKYFSVDHIGCFEQNKGEEIKIDHLLYYWLQFFQKEIDMAD